MLANHTEYGLASYVFSENPDILWRAFDNLEVGTKKASGLGREGSKEGMLEYTEVQMIGVRDPHAKS